MQNESITLHYVEGSSSKTYQCQLERNGDLWVVNFQYGRIGASLTAGTKTTEPQAYDKAKRIFDRLLAEKKAKGYTECASGRAYSGTENAGRISGIPIMLLNPIKDEADIEALIRDPAWCCEIKFDGERRLAHVSDGGVVGINRKGLTVAIDDSIGMAVEDGGFAAGTILDGEDMGGRLIVFDVLSFEGRDLTSIPLSLRLKVREEVFARAPGLGGVVTATSLDQKRLLVERARADKQEGVVFKRLDSPYVGGRPNSGGPALKAKFVETATVRVAAGTHDGKRSVGMEVMDPSTAIWAFLGNVTIPPGAAIPDIGSAIDCHYLYAMRGGGLIQPIYARTRTDLDASDCVIGQLKFKDERKLVA